MSIERLGSSDRLQWATDIGPAPELVGAVLCLGPGPVDPSTLAAEVERRVAGIPRLRQRLATPPPGAGAPYWVDDGAFAIDHHVRTVTCEPGEDEALLRLVGEVMATPLDLDRPLWRLVHLTGLARGDAVVVVFHHVLADGIGGLAVLAGLVDGATVVEPAEPRPGPSVAQLYVDNLARLGPALRRFPRWLREVRRGVAALRAQRLPKAAPTSLNRPTGPSRAVASVRVGLAPIQELAHAHEATVNDVLLTAVGGALAATLRRRGEEVPEVLVISVPVSGRASTPTDELGNQVGVRPTAVPLHGTPVARLAALAEERRSIPPVDAAASMAAFSPTFRLLARLHLLRPFVDHQHLVHSFVTNLRGPATPLRFLDRDIEEVMPVSAISGNVTVAFAALSYAGAMVVTLVADPDAWPDLAELRQDLDDELARLLPVSV